MSGTQNARKTGHFNTKNVNGDDLGGGGFAFGGVVLAGDGTHRDGDAIPGVDGGDGISEVDEFIFGELFAGSFVYIIRDVSLGDEGQGFCPLEGGALARSEERGFAPGIQGVEALLGVAEGAGVNGMHINAIGAAIDLGSAKLDEVQELLLDGGRLEMFFEREHGVQGVG
jgi:hypothetical protein